MTTPSANHATRIDADSLRAAYVTDMAAHGDFATETIQDVFTALDSI